MKTVNIIIYYICFTFCLIQLLGWILGPFMGIEVIYSAIKNGFYNKSIGTAWKMKPHTFSVLNKSITITYFLSLFFVVISIFFKKNNKIFSLVLGLSLLVLFIISLWQLTKVLFNLTPEQ
ncbi:hypothetical protein CMU93_00635 [Elizabethkingia anophelis]|nr:hypothetical protein [Elizabethkingia anophelis]